MPVSYDISGKVSLVTGAASGMEKHFREMARRVKRTYQKISVITR